VDRVSLEKNYDHAIWIQEFQSLGKIWPGAVCAAHGAVRLEQFREEQRVAIFADA
jgi:hypothetical protein